MIGSSAELDQASALLSNNTTDGLICYSLGSTSISNQDITQIENIGGDGTGTLHVQEVPVGDTMTWFSDDVVVTNDVRDDTCHSSLIDHPAEHPQCT